MSISGSIEINSATSVTGNPIVGNTTSAAKVAPPPTPAMPNELMVTTSINIKKNSGAKGSRPTEGAIITASIDGYIPAQPFWPMVAPKLADKLAMLG